MDHPPQHVCPGEQAKLLDECHRTASGKPETGADTERVVLGGAPHDRHDLVLVEQLKDTSLIRVGHDHDVGGAGLTQRVKHDIGGNASAEAARYLTRRRLVAAHGLPPSA